MTETEKMLAILRERGIEYREVNSMVTDIEHDGIKTRVYDYDDGPDYQLCVEQKWLTAEEAVRVALGIKPQEVLERRIDELCAEVEYVRQTSRSRLELIDQLRTENAKLRELLSSYWKRTHSPVGPSVERDYLLELRELGIEVDE